MTAAGSCRIRPAYEILYAVHWTGSPCSCAFPDFTYQNNGGDLVNTIKCKLCVITFWRFFSLDALL